MTWDIVVSFGTLNDGSLKRVGNTLHSSELSLRIDVCEQILGDLSGVYPTVHLRGSKYRQRSDGVHE